jgi:uncharacterized protein with HEPN domain
LKEKREFIDFAAGMLRAVEDAEDFTKGMDYEKFFLDRKTSMAVVRCLEVLGEAAKHIPREVKHNNREIPWKIINGLRNRIAHDYMRINLKIVWIIVKDELPKLKPAIKNLNNIR